MQAELLTLWTVLLLISSQGMFATETLRDALKRSILGNRDLSARPVSNQDEVIQINFTIGINHIHMHTIEDYTATADIIGWQQYRFNIPLYAWNASEFGGMKTLHVPMNEIWMPDWSLINGLNVNKNEMKDILVTISDNGDVYADPRAKHSIKCLVQDHKAGVYGCSMRFSPWQHGVNEIDANFLGNMTSLMEDVDYTPMPSEYKIGKIKLKRNVRKFNCCEHPFVDLDFSFTVNRRPRRRKESPSDTSGATVYGMSLLKSIVLYVLLEIFVF